MDAGRSRILVTGAAGRVGREIVPLLREHYALRLFDNRRLRAVHDDEVVRGDIRWSRLDRVCAGVHAVVHLAAVPFERRFLARLLPTNIVGTYRIFEAARRTGVGTVVFASTGQTVEGYGEQWVTTDMPPRPASLYACTKLLGEALGRYYADRHGMSVVCLRIGWFEAYGGPLLQRQPELTARWCSPGDLSQLVVRSIQADVDYAVFFAVSDNPRRNWDVEDARRLVGYEPKDRAPEVIGD